MSVLVSPEKEIASPLPSSTSSVPTSPRSGIHAALWIPTDDAGNLKRDALATHLNWLKQKGLHGVLALGSTGEFARMSFRQREEVMAAVIELSEPLPVIANLSSINLQEVIALGKTAKRLGAVGAALMPPPFFPVPQEDILEFFLRAAEAVDLPFYLYNYPEVTGNRIGLEVISAFADQAHMAGIKQSGGELSYHDDLISLGREKDFAVFTAADPMLATYLDKGAAGCLGGVANFLPEYMLEVFEACRAGRSASVSQTSSRLAKAGEVLSPLCLPHNVRAAVEARGFDPGAFKTVISSRTLGVYENAVAQFHALYAEWGLLRFDEAS